MVNAIVDSQIRLPVRELNPKALDMLRREIRVPNPEYVQRSIHNRYLGATPKHLLLYTEGALHFSVPRGAHHKVRAVLDACGLPLKWVDMRIKGRAFDVQLNGLSLRDYQKAARDALITRVQAVAVLPCGAGKTVIGCACIAKTKTPTLVVVHTSDLLRQWQESVKTYLGVEPGTLTAGKWEPREVTVATVQTLEKKLGSLRAVAGYLWGAVIVDEAHHTPATTFRKVIGAVPARYRWGLTATPRRGDGLTPLLELYIGQVEFNVGHKELVQNGFLMLPKVVKVDVTSGSDAEDYHGLMRDLVSNEERNDQIRHIVKQAVKAGRATLVLTGRVEHAHALSEALRADGLEARALTSKTPKKARATTVSELRDGSIQVVCATSLADEGLDIKRLEAVVQATPMRSQGRTIQRLGRLMRPSKGKSTPILYDLVDDHPIALRQWTSRRRAYQRVLGAKIS